MAGTVDVTGVEILFVPDIHQLEVALVFDQPVGEFLYGDMVIARGNQLCQTGRLGAQLRLCIIAAAGCYQYDEGC